MSVTTQTPVAAKTPKGATTAQRAGHGSRVRPLLIAASFLWVGLLLLLPFGGILWTAIKAGWSTVASTFSDPYVQHAFELTAEITVVTVAVTTFFGVLVAWVLVRQHFRGKGLLNALVDLPFALSPVTVGLAAVILFGRGGWFEPWFTAHGIQIMYAVPAMVLVTIFISLPFTIREVQPVLEELGKDEEDASRTLGASIGQTFRKVTLPNIRWALLYGIALSTARAIGEIGAVLLVSGHIQGKTDTATLYIYGAVENRQLPSAYVVAITLALVSILLLAGIEFAKRHLEKERKST